MPDRYRSYQGVVVGRRALPSGDVLLKLLTPEGPVEAMAKSAQRPGGRSGRLGLFYRLRFQVYRRPGSELATLTQVALEETLAPSEPFRFAAAGFLAELAWKSLSPEVAARGYPIFVSGLRGIAQAEDPRLPLVWAGFRLLALAGYAPGGSGPYLSPEGRFVGGGGGGAVFLGQRGATALQAVLRRPGREATRALESAPLDRLLEAILRYAEHQLEGLRAARALRGLAGS